MDSKEQHIRELLRRWTTGEITAREEAELFAAAQEDTFLREALAAYQGQAELDHAASLTRLRQQTQQALPLKRNTRNWLAIAASLLLLITAGWWAIQQQTALDVGTVAMEEAPPVSSSSDVTPSSAQTDTSEDATPAAEDAEMVPPSLTQNPGLTSPARTTIKDNLQQETPKAKQESIASTAELRGRSAKESRAEAPLPPTTYQSVPTPLDTSVVTLEADELLATEDSSLPPAPPPPPPPMMQAPARTDTPVQSRSYTQRLEDRNLSTNSGVPVPSTGFKIIEGYVTDTEGYPLIGASVLEEGSANGTVTDLDGFYRLTVAESSEQLLVSYTGYTTTEINIGEEQELNITLAASTSLLDEVVVTGLGVNQSQEDYLQPQQRVVPAGGFKYLRDYLAENTPANTPRARVKLRFFVKADGSLTGFSVLRSTNVGQNELAIELLQNGPRWEINDAVPPVEVVYVVKFK